MLTRQAATLSLKELSILKPLWRKKPAPEPLLKRNCVSSRYQHRIPKSIDGLEVILYSREHPAKFLVKYKGKQRLFWVTKEVYSAEEKKLNYETYMDVLGELFVIADILQETNGGSPLPKRRRKNKYWEILDPLLTGDLNEVMSTAKKVRDKLEHLFGKEYESYRILFCYEKRSLKSIYRIEDKIKIDYQSEGVFYDWERTFPRIQHHVQLPYEFKPFDGLDLEFLNYIKRVDPFYVRIDSPFTSLFYTNSGSLIGMSNSSEHYTVTLNNMDPIDRQVVFLKAYRRREAFIMFKDSILNVEEGQHYNSVSSREGWGCITSSSKQHVLNSEGYFNRHSKFYKKGSPFLDETGRIVGI